MIGGAGVLALVSLNELRKLLTWPALHEIHNKATVPLPNRGDDSKVTIYGFEAAGDYPSYHRGNVDSPYVARVEAYCRLHKIAYEKKAAKPIDNPRGKLPFANIRGVMVDDSSKIIASLGNKFGIKNGDNEAWTPEQQAQARLIRQTLFGSLYFVQLHHMFETEEGRQIFVDYKSQRLPPWPISRLILAKIFRNQRQNLQGSGVGRHSHQEIVQMGRNDLACLSTLLGASKSEYMLGTPQPTDLDADVYAFLAFMFWDDTLQVHPWVQDIQKELPNLVQYTERMRAHLYPELVKNLKVD